MNNFNMFFVITFKHDKVYLPGHEPNYVTFTAEEAGSTIGLAKLGSVHSLEYSIDLQSWIPMTTTTSVTLANVSDKVYVRGILSADLSNDDYNYTLFVMTGKIAASGNCNTLWNYQDLTAPLKEFCGIYMFDGCASLTQAPELPATTLVNSCYSSMFRDCTSLSQAPELPATALAGSCYYRMFEGCTSLSQAPELPATALASGCVFCYANMFNSCTSLSQAPELPATTLTDGCYSSMFYGCTNLSQAPELPATTLASSCYGSMFYGCTSLSQAPELPATALTDYCYNQMFYGCANLSTIKCLATDISASNALTNWTDGVASTGTFTKASDVEWPSGTSGIPIGWTVKTHGTIQQNYVTFTAEEAGSTIGLAKLGSVHSLEYSIDLQSWIPMTAETSVTLANINDKVYVRGILNDNLSSSDYTLFVMTGKIAASGNCNALWNYEDLEALLKNYCGYQMFYNCTSLTTSPELPATTLSRYCYCGMFNGCTLLAQAPALPATTLTMSCYYRMFEGCTSLTTAPALPATTLGFWCYYNMFYGCTSLTTAPELPATTLSVNCYCSMFYGCTSLTTAPELPATTLEDYCYMYMFKGCTSLSSIKCPATDISATGALTDWTEDVASTGTFYKAVGVTWPTGTSGIPSGWTVVEV